MALFTMDVIEDTSLGYKVYRGSAKACDLDPAMWIDFYDEQLNPLGYQRPFDVKRSASAAIYTTQANAFWPECILAIRSGEDADEEKDKISYKFVPTSPGSRFGKLNVYYDNSRTENVNGHTFKWRRAFSEVDCQHRLGSMSKSTECVTVCIIPGISRSQEALIFKTINEKQKRVSTSLVDAIVQLSQSKLAAPEVHWAFNLSRDVASPFCGKVNMEGKNLSGQKYLVTLRTLRTSISMLVGGARYVKDNLHTEAEFDQFYILIRSYWQDVHNLWPTEFASPRGFKLMTVHGLKGLAKYGQTIFRDALDVGANNTALTAKVSTVGPTGFDWSLTGPLATASGNAGVKPVFDSLVQKYGVP